MRTDRIRQRVAVGADVGIVRREFTQEGDAIRRDRQCLVTAAKLPEEGRGLAVACAEVQGELEIMRSARNPARP